MSYAPPALIVRDPTAGGAWTRTLDGSCVCACPAPTLALTFSTRTRVFDSGAGASGPFGDWSAYGPGGIGTFVAINTDPDSGGAETQVRVRIVVAGNGRAGVVRYRQLFAEDSGSGPGAHTVITPGALQTLMVPGGGATVDFTFAPCAIGQSSILSGPPGGGTVGGVELLNLVRQSAYLRKHGWQDYTGDASVKIYREELVNAGGDPGCGGGRPARTYSGHQVFEAVAADPSNNYTADPTGQYVSTLSDDLAEDRHASTRFDQPSTTVEFGTVTHPDPTSKLMVEEYACGAGTVSKSLELVLASEYPTADLQAAVAAALAAQVTHGVSVAPQDPRVVHREWLSPCEVHCERVHTHQVSGSAGPFDAVLGGPGQTLTVTLSCEVVTRGLDPGAATATSTLNLSARVQASGALLVGPAGRTAVAPDLPIDPLEDLWSVPQTEVLIRQVRIKPHKLLAVAMPYVEDPAVIGVGVDG